MGAVRSETLFSGSRRFRQCRLVRPRCEPRGDRQAIPRIDGCDGQRQVRELRFVEVRLNRRMHRARNMAVRDECHRLGPGERVQPGRRVADAPAQLGELAPVRRHLGVVLGVARFPVEEHEVTGTAERERVAHELAGVEMSRKPVAVTEGGYNLQTLPRLVHAALEGFSAR